MELFKVFSIFDITVDRGRGCKVWDTEGQEYLDLYGGHAVISVGHCHPRYVEAMTRQLGKLGFYSNSVRNPLQEEFARRLGKACGYDDYRLFLVNTGAEANENALKLASFHNGRTRILAADKAFHGRTSLAVEATDNSKIVAPVNANGHVCHLPLNDIEAWKKEIEKGDVCAVILECIQGIGGIRLAEKEFVTALRRLCDETGTVLVMDEIQCGYGRSGMFFAHQYTGVKADIVTVAKGICNGFPMAAVIISPKFAAVQGMLGTTFGGNHLACAGALAVLDIMESENLVQNARDVGAYLLERLRSAHLRHVADIRGRGLMIGVELDIPYKETRARLVKEQHCFTGCAGTNIIRLLPPLCITKDEADDFIGRFGKALADTDAAAVWE